MRSEYLQLLKKQVSKYVGTLSDVIILAPVYGMLMFTLMKDPRLSREQRLLVDAAIAYLVSPDDVIPENEIGSYGYLDDVFCCAYVAHQIGEELGWEVVEEHWTGDQSVLEVSRNLLVREQELLGDSGDDILRFAGLLDARSEPDGKPEIVLESA